MKYFSYFLPETRVQHFMQTLHEMSNSIYLEKYFKVRSTENFTQSAKCYYELTILHWHAMDRCMGLQKKILTSSSGRLDKQVLVFVNLVNLL